MKKKWLSALALASAFVLVTAPNAVLPTAASATVSPDGAGEWDYLGFDSGYVATSYTQFSRVWPSGGGDFQVKVLTNETGGKLSIRLVKLSTGSRTAEQYVSTTGAVVFSNLTAGDYYVEMKTAGSYKKVVAEFRD